ncbi:phage holin family protein [Carnobacterium maltaromaticum]|uniref:phage holin family protein n=1 Tax=Carnobacterium maltaromaticum TaxID=2751 RepID=UPI0039BE7B9F
MNLEQYYIAIVLLACLIVGYVIKNTPMFLKVANGYIPLIVTVLGGILGCVANQSITLENIVYGALSGLASTGLHQMFSRLIENRKDDK